MDSHSENFRVYVMGARDLLPNEPIPAYDFVDKIYDVEAPNRDEAAENSLERARDESDDERFEYRVVKVDRAKPRSEQKGYDGVDRDEDGNPIREGNGEDS